jgi:hypothetical protein
MAVKSFSLGMAVGYVLGARAGERRYEQIVNWSQKLLDTRLAERLTEQGKDLAKNKARQVVDTVKTRGLRDFPAQGRADDDGGDGDDGDEGDDEYEDDDEVVDEYDEDGDGEPGDDDQEDDEDARSIARGEDDDGASNEPEAGKGHQEASDDEQDPAESKEPGGGRGSKLGGLVAAARERGRVD